MATMVYFLLCMKWVQQNDDVNYPPGNPQIWVSEHAIAPKFSHNPVKLNFRRSKIVAGPSARSDFSEFKCL